MLHTEIEIQLRKVERWISEEEQLLAQYRASNLNSAVPLVESVIEDLKTARAHLLEKLGLSDSTGKE